MAVPLPDSYSAATGQGIYGGRYNTVSMDVVNNVWTPTKDGNGDILGGSWSNLPLDEWCSVAGTELQGLRDALVAAGRNPAVIDHGTGAYELATFNAWVGCATDLTNGDVWVPWGGGHADSSMNGVWHINLERMGSWDVALAPSDPAAVGYEWSADYKASNNFTTYQPALDDPGDILPDGMPTSRHQYNGVWYDPDRNLVCQSRRRLWAFNPTTQQVSSQLWYESAALIRPTIVHDIHYDEVAQQPIGFFPRTDLDAYYWAALDPDTGNVTALPGRYAGNSRAICRIGRDLMLISDNDNYGLFDMDSRAWHSTATLTDNPAYDYQQEMQVCVYIPEWDKVLRRFTKSGLSGAWYLFDPSTLTHSTYTPQGITMPNPTWPGNKCFYYPARKSVIYITATALGDSSIHVMRVG